MASGKKRKTVKDRLHAKGAGVAAKASSPVPKLKRPPPLSRGTLASLRQLSTPREVSRSALRRERRRLLPRVEREIRDSGFDYRRIGVASAAEAAEVLVTMAEQVRYGEYTLTELRKKARWLIATWNGKVFERVVHHDRQLHDELSAMARDDLRYLNADLARKPPAAGKDDDPLVVDATGAATKFRGTFSEVVRVGNIRLKRRGAKAAEEFMDVADVALVEEDGKWYASVLVAGEMKTPAAAREMSEQVSRQAARFAGGEELSFELPGGKVQTIAAERLLFNLRGTQRFGVRAGKREGIAWASTVLGGYQETYLRVTKQVDMPAMSGLTSMLFPR